MRPIRPTLVAVLLVGLFLAGSSAYIVSEFNQAVITQFGEPVGDPITEPGLHFKIPFIQTANMFEKRFLEWDGFPNQVPTRDRRFIWVDTYARGASPTRCCSSSACATNGARSRGSTTSSTARRATPFARHDLIEIVRTSNREPAAATATGVEEAEVLAPIATGREQITREILEAAAAAVGELGIELLDLQFKRINYIADVQQDVFARMIAERQRIAAEFRSEGQGESARIQGERERDLARIQSEAFRAAEEIRGTADAEAIDIYADAYNQDAAFYAFTKSLETYERTMDPGTFLILGTDSQLLRFLETPR